jgi:hypothetical protein
MAYETFNKSGTMSRSMFDTEMSKDGWDDGNREKRDYMKSGRHAMASKAQNNYKFKSGSEAPGNTSRREYPKKGHHGSKFGSVKSQGS